MVINKILKKEVKGIKLKRGYTDRQGRGKEMIQRKVRLTQDENNKLNYIIKCTNRTLRDTFTDLVEEKYNKLK